MGVVEVVLLILAMKIPIVGLFALVWWAGRPADAEGPAEEPVSAPHPTPPQPWRPGRPRLRGPHGGAANVRPARGECASGPQPAFARISRWRKSETSGQSS